ncbi:uncharacterized protein EHS24_007261 [Apiotrichum porosum]|uniref:Uncharacterized protein n=1 Tax=Apiotrichum porosum TaxID=105984 RepID=A0A427XXL2_9TREE|nr:uncharacterized protein EHS24_007261 [Apiotrichum porosum]RSH83573.1 hypothetical protein EHS24_007261 [Apiotrichum porosum]
MTPFSGQPCQRRETVKGCYRGPMTLTVVIARNPVASSHRHATGVIYLVTGCGKAVGGQKQTYGPVFLQLSSTVTHPPAIINTISTMLTQRLATHAIRQLHPVSRSASASVLTAIRLQPTPRQFSVTARSQDKPKSAAQKAREKVEADVVLDSALPSDLPGAIKPDAPKSPLDKLPAGARAVADLELDSALPSDLPDAVKAAKETAQKIAGDVQQAALAGAKSAADTLEQTAEAVQDAVNSKQQEQSGKRELSGLPPSDFDNTKLKPGEYEEVIVDAPPPVVQTTRNLLLISALLGVIAGSLYWSKNGKKIQEIEEKKLDKMEHEAVARAKAAADAAQSKK